MTVFAFESSRENQSVILEEYNISNNELRFFPVSTSVFDLLQWNPDVIIQDYNKGHIIDCNRL